MQCARNSAIGGDTILIFQTSRLLCKGTAEYDSLVIDQTLLGLVTDWGGFLHSVEDGPIKKLRRATRTGRPAGDGALVTTVEGLTGRDLSKGRPGGGLESARYERRCYVPGI